MGNKQTARIIPLRSPQAQRMFAKLRQRTTPQPGSPASGSQRGSTVSPEAMASLRGKLETGWQKFFTAVHAGKNWGLPCKCFYCDQRPPKDLKSYAARWRWVRTHEFVRHGEHE